MGARRPLRPCTAALRLVPALLMVLAATLAPAFVACNATSTTVAGAAVSTGLAAGFSAARRSGGDCYTECNNGTSCNRSTGLCERLPCRGECLAGEKCEESWTGGVRCLGPDGLAVQHSAQKNKDPAATGIAPVLKPVEGSSSAPADARLPAEGDALPPR
jgi:hypothetical protein